MEERAGIKSRKLNVHNFWEGVRWQQMDFCGTSNMGQSFCVVFY